MIKSHGLLHFTIPVKDLDRSEKFYKEIFGFDRIRLCVPKTLSALIGPKNHLTSVDHVRIVLLRLGRLGLAIQVEEAT
jgi:catechol 2,3-dioxygenase-like lactoylglutathione lyase family enzyme